MNFDLEIVKGLVLTYGLKVLGAIIVFVVGRWISKKITDIIIGLLENKNVDVTLTKFLRAIVYYALLVMVIIAAAGQLGVETTSFMAILGAASLAIGLALKDSLSNFSSGVMLIIFRPFRVGDYVDCGGESGTVEAITVFNTVLNTPDNQKKIIPNGQISNNTITNVTANPTRRIDMVVGVSYDDDIRTVKNTLVEIIAEQPLLLKDPKALIAVSELADSSVNLVIRPWVKTGDYWVAYFSLLESIKIRFDEKGISFPFPQQDVHVFSEEEACEVNQ
ncbi:MAG: mechanosensitive ion channel [Desulfotalea sp.]